MIRSTKDFWAGLIYLFFGSTAVIVARDYDMGTALKMGPAYFPTVLGWLLMAVGGLALIRAFMSSDAPLGALAWKKLFLIVGSTILFGLILRRAGLIVAVPLLVLTSGMASRHFRWIPTVGLAGGLTAFCIFVFLKGLGVPIPVIGPWFGG
ncbi:MAG TPA: tripartite tricarboxylate transporter TctB family protein [Candidatus Eisenbacteria bacterium]|nr:tripartite tricarboxylate transporter TctB family protein [Candidatus Eisenbacteria bacterium]